MSLFITDDDGQGSGTEADVGPQSREELPNQQEPEEPNPEAAAQPDPDDTAEDDEAEEDESGADDPPPADDKPPAKKTVQARFNEFRRMLGDAQRANEALTARLTALESGKPPAKEQTPAADVLLDRAGKPLVEPKPDDFKYGEVDPDYHKALGKYSAAAALAEERAEQAKADEERERNDARISYETKRDAMTETGTKEYPDFEEKVIQGAVDKSYAISPLMAQLILESDGGYHVAYHLATHPKEAREIFGKSPAAQAATFGRLEERFLSAKAAKTKATPASPVPKIPAPPTHQSRGANGKFSVGADSPDFAAFEKSVGLEALKRR
jgi:hypothetical protein